MTYDLFFNINLNRKSIFMLKSNHMKYSPADPNGLKTFSIKDRHSKVSIEKSAVPHVKGGSFRDFAGSLPGFLAANDIKAVVQAVVRAYKNGRPVVLGMGAHPIKVG